MKNKTTKNATRREKFSSIEQKIHASKSPGSGNDHELLSSEEDSKE